MLGDFLRLSASRPFVWGVCDCMLWPADAVLHVTGIDPAADLRGAYDSPRGALALMRARGGLIGLMAAQLDGLAEQGPGDGVGVVRAGRREYGAVIVGGKPWLKGDGAVWTGDLPILASWRV
jgi:hypothetical protein